MSGLESGNNRVFSKMGCYIPKCIGCSKKLCFSLLFGKRRNERRRLYLDTFDKKRIQNIRYLVTTKNYLILTIDIEKGNFLSLCWEISLNFRSFLLIKSSSKTWWSEGSFFLSHLIIDSCVHIWAIIIVWHFFPKEKIHQMEERWALKSIANVSSNIFLCSLHA